MSAGWHLNTIDSLAETVAMGPFGSSIKKETYVEAGVPVINGKNLHHARLNDTAGYGFISEDHANALSKANAYPGDVVITHRGTLGQVSLIPTSSEYDRYVISQSQMLIRPDQSKLNSAFLTYYLHSRPGQGKLLSFASQTGVPALAQPTASIKQLAVPTPPIKVQEAIAGVLSALDDKIEANERLVDTAGALQTALFNSLLKDSSHFPLTSLAEFINGKAFTKGATGKGRMVIRIAELNKGPGRSTVYNDIAVDKKHLACPGDILFAWSGSLTLHRWYRAESIINQHIFKVIPHDDVPPWLAFELIRHKLAEFQSIAADKATTMGHIQRKHLDEPVAVPSQESIKSADAYMQSLWDLALRAEQECLSLAQLRDALLPQLMTGTLKVRHAERIAEEVV